jgi:hypothetical protein
MRLTGVGKRTLAQFIRRHGSGRGKKLFYKRLEDGLLKGMMIDKEEIKPVIKPVVEEVKETVTKEVAKEGILEKVKKVLKV